MFRSDTGAETWIAFGDLGGALDAAIVLGGFDRGVGGKYLSGGGKKGGGKGVTCVCMYVCMYKEGRGWEGDGMWM